MKERIILFISLASIYLVGRITGTALPLIVIAVLLTTICSMFWRRRFAFRGAHECIHRDFEAAKPLYQAAIERRERVSGLYVLLAECHLELAEPETAVAMCDREIARKPNKWTAYLYRAQAALDCAKYQQSLDDADKAMSLGCPKNEFYRIRALAKVGMKNLDEALADCEKLKESSGRNGPYLFRSTRSIIMFNKGNFDQAVEDCSEALKIVPKSGLAMNLYYRARSYTALGQLDKAQADLRSADSLPRSPRDIVRILCAKAQIAIKEGRIESALTYADEALKMQPDAPFILFVHALALTRSGDAQGAVAELDRAIGIDAYSAESYWARSQAYTALAQADKAEQDTHTYERLGYHPYL